MALNKTTRNAIDDSAITTEKIEDGAITAGKLAAGDLSISKTLLLNAAPTISSLNTSQINPDSGATVTITGTGFVSIPDVRFLNTSTGVRIQASTVGFTSSTTITAAFPSGQTVGTYKVLVENPDGKGVISTSTIIYSAAPTWSTAANLGSIEEGEAVNIQLLAYDDDSTAVSSYSLVSGSLPSGVTLSGDSSVGSLTGTAPAVDADTNYTFTIRATDDEGQTSDREFTLTITNWEVANSLRFDDGSSDYLTRTPSSASNTRTFTFSAWVKRCNESGANVIFQQGSDTANRFSLNFQNEKLRWRGITGGSNTAYLQTNRAFRDPSAWYHIVARFDSTNATAGDRMRLYVNGVEETSFSTDINPSLNYESFVNTTNPIDIGRDNASNASFFDGYMAEVCLIDGQALDPTSFGETDTASGIWKPKSVSGLTFGTNGFYLPFTNSGSLGADSSGNSNDFTVNNLTAIDQTTDTPVNNFATLNALTPTINTTHVYTDGNLTADPTYVSAGGVTIFHTINPLKGKWYYEIKAETSAGSGNAVHTGVVTGTSATNYTSSSTQSGAEFDIYSNNIEKRSEGSSSIISGSSFSSGDIGMIAVDMDNGKIYIGKNGTWLESSNPATSSNPSVSFTVTDDLVFFTSPVTNSGNSNKAKANMNFGNPPFTISSGNSDANGYGNFEYAVPSGYFALNTKNLAEYG